ncbi:MAG: ATP-binding protein [bacterium]
MHNGNFSEHSAAVILLSGLPGSGKTTFAHTLREGLDFEHIESDAIRRQISPNPSYSFAESGAVFARVDAAARRAISTGTHALIDATNLTNRDRRRFYRLASELGARLFAVRITAPDDLIRERLRHPREGYSQAGLEVFERVRTRPQPFPGPSIAVDSRYSLVPAIDLLLRLIDDQEA